MSIRSKIAAMICAGVLAVGGSAAAYAEDYSVVVFAQAGQKCSLANLKSTLAYPIPNGSTLQEWWGEDSSADESMPVLTKSRTLKKCFQLKQGETLIIPKGKTLTLTGGANIHGDIYIEKGGRLLLKHDALSLFGRIICEGTLEVTGGTFTGFDGSLLYVTEAGKFTAADRGITELDDGCEINGRIDILAGANAVCFGKTNIPVPYLESEPVAAVFKKQSFGGAYVQTERITDSTRLNAVVGTPIRTGFEYSDMDFAEFYTVLFSGGGTVTYTASGTIDNGFNEIGGVDVQLIRGVLDTWHRPTELKTAENAFSKSTYVARAKYLSHTVNEEYVEYTFELVDGYKGRTDSTITLRRDSEWSDEYIQEFTEGEYVLPLRSVEPENSEKYYVLSCDLYIPVNGGKADCVYVLGEKNELARAVTTDYLAELALYATSYPELDIISE